MREFKRPHVVLSACIEHQAVRFDGTMISDEVIRKLKEFVTFHTVCPEVAVGMPSPREAVRLVERDGEELKLLTSLGGEDYTEKMRRFTGNYLNRIASLPIDGFILKAKSPTCGTDKIKVYRDIGKAHTKQPVQNGMFAEEIVQGYPDSFIESERRLSNYNIREDFFISIFTMASFRDVTNVKELQKFHQINKYLFMSYQQKKLKSLGNIAANREKKTAEEVINEYKTELVDLLKTTPSKQKRINVLTHLYGYFKNKLNDSEKAYYFETQNDYLQNHVPFSTPLMILKGFVVRFNEDYLATQTIFEPYPKQLLTQLDSGKKV